MVVLNDIEIESLSENIVEKIILDISDRRGLDYEWDNIELGIKEEIKQTWKEIIRENFEVFK